MMTIRFDLDKVQVQDVPRREDLSAEEIQATWYTDKDFKRMRSSRRRSKYKQRRLLLSSSNNIKKSSTSTRTSEKEEEEKEQLLYRKELHRQDSIHHHHTLIVDSILRDAAAAVTDDDDGDEPRRRTPSTRMTIPPAEGGDGMKRIGKKGSRIRFDMNIMTRDIEHIDDLSGEEILATWYSFKAFRQMRKREAKLVRPGGASTDCGGGDVLLVEQQSASFVCELGIETTQEREQRRIRSRQAKTCVISEQKQQKENGRHDPKLLARIYRMTAREGGKAAHKRGWVNAECVCWEARVEEGMHLKSSSSERNHQNSVLSMPPPPPPYQTLSSPRFSPHKPAVTHRWRTNPLDTSLVPPMKI
jgi:hypothetical protein